MKKKQETNAGMKNHREKAKKGRKNYANSTYRQLFYVTEKKFQQKLDALSLFTIMQSIEI